MRYERKILVYGDVDENSVINVSVGGSNVKSGLVKSGKNVEVYSFTDTVKRHGNLPVSLEIETGSLTFTKVRSLYPAIIRSNDEFVIGNVLFDQPINSPLYTFDESSNSVNPIDYKLTSSITFNHLFFNGPSYWLVDVDTITDLTIDVGCIHEVRPCGGVSIEYIPPYIQPVFLYMNELFEYNDLINKLHRGN